MGKIVLTSFLIVLGQTAQAQSKFFCYAKGSEASVSYVVAMTDPYLTKAPKPQVVLISEDSTVEVAASYEAPTSDLFHLHKFAFVQNGKAGVFTVSEALHSGGCTRVSCNFGSTRSPIDPNDFPKPPTQKQWIGKLEIDQTPAQFFSCNEN